VALLSQLLYVGDIFRSPALAHAIFLFGSAGRIKPGKAEGSHSGKATPSSENWVIELPTSG
jgi:hypothetical protein